MYVLPYFGSTSILTLSELEVKLSVILSIVVIVLFVLFYNKIFAITFDESFTKAIGINVELYNLLIAIITATIIVLGMNLVGSLLVSALIIFPAITSMRIFNNFKKVTISSAIISVICALIGILTSILVGTPVGSTIVGVNIIAFVITYFIGKILSRRIQL